MTSVSVDSSINVTSKNSMVETGSSWYNRLCKRLVLSSFANLETSQLVVYDGDNVYRYGDESSDLSASIHVHDAAVYKCFVVDGSIGAGEAFMKGYWSSPDVLAVVRVFCQNIKMLNKHDHNRPIFSRLMSRLVRYRNINSLTGSRKNISAHYDLGNEFFSLFLDSSMMYSSAIYKGDDMTLGQASKHKLDVICHKLKLNQSDHLLEIGTGWGGLAIYAAKNYGCKVTTTTISQQQYDYAIKSVKKAGLENQIIVLLKDYRELKGQYDKLVSIEMLEAVGFEYYQQYFSTCARLLKEDGLMCIQAITIADQRYEYAKKSEDFIKRYIFPGGCLPSVSVIADSAARYTDLQIVHLQDIGRDYAKTLADWRSAFLSKLNEVRDLGYSESFCRMWEYYLCYCEGGFLERTISTSQVLMAKPKAIYDYSRI